jgi:hypothetical protein
MAKPSDKEIFERLAQAWLKLAELRQRDREPELEVFDKIPFSAHEQRAQSWQQTLRRCLR